MIHCTLLFLIFSFLDFESTLNETFNLISDEVSRLLAALNETILIHNMISNRNYSFVMTELSSYQVLVSTSLSQSELFFSEVEGQFERLNDIFLRLNELESLLEAARNRAVQTFERSQEVLNNTQQAENLVININVSA